MGISSDLKFDFTPEFQEDLIKFVLTHKDGYKLVNHIHPDYFSLNEDSVLFEAIRSFYKRDKRIPGQTVLIEKLSKMLRQKTYYDLFTQEEQQQLLNKAKKLSEGYVRDADILLEKASGFAKYVEVAHVLENTDITQVESYESLLKDLSKAMTTARDTKKDYGSFLIQDVKSRQLRRKEHNSIVPTPFKQINRLTNAGGYSKGSILVILDKPKKFKTGMLINLATGYLKMRKRVLIIDLENGEDEYMTRIEQNLSGLTKLDIIQGESDQKVQKILRKYKRLGAELVVMRRPSITTTPNEVAHIMHQIQNELGISFNVLILDYAALLGSNTGTKDETERIGQVYIELGNLAKEMDIDHVWTANHVQRASGNKREATRYIGDDIAKAIDIVRHTQAIFGLNRSAEEEAAGIMRMEVVEQRDGKPYGRALFKVNPETQRATELTLKEIEDYYNNFGEVNPDGEDGEDGPVLTQNGRVMRTSDL
jgi:hypothetical protein